MIVHDLNGKSSPWKLTGHLATKNGYHNRKRSKLHLIARGLIAEIFPTLQVLEEVPIKPLPPLTLYLDFYLPLIQTTIEVHGQQHYAYSSLFHKTKWDFIKQRKNDSFKAQWCNINNIDLIILPYNEESSEWRNRLSSTEDG